MQVSDLFATRLSVVAATALVYAAFALLKVTSQLVINKDKLSRIEAEVKAWEERKRRAIQARDVKLYERVQREQARIDKMKREADLERMKASTVTFLAWPVLLTILWRITGDPFVALAPAPWGYERISFSTWFIINTFWASALLDRLSSFLPISSKRKRVAR